MSIQNNITFSEWFVSSFSSKVYLIYLLMSVHGNTFDCFSHFFSEEKFLKRLKDSFYRAIKFKFQVFWKCRLAYWVKRQCDGRWVWSAKRLKTIDQGHLVLLLCCGVKNMTPTKSRKRPLLVKSSAPPPRTATTIRVRTDLGRKSQTKQKITTKRQEIE